MRNGVGQGVRMQGVGGATKEMIEPSLDQVLLWRRLQLFCRVRATSVERQVALS